MATSLTDQFFDQPILNWPYEYPSQHWELDEDGQPTNQILNKRRRAEFITPIPKPKKRRQAQGIQKELLLYNSDGLSTETQQYDPTPIINSIREQVATWRQLLNPVDWRVTPETARLLQHWRQHSFQSIRPFFCQIEAVETAIWLAEVTPKIGKVGKQFLEHIDNANGEANPELLRVALKLATGAGKTTVMAMRRCLANCQCGASSSEQAIYPWIFNCYTWDYNSRSPSGSSTKRSRQLLCESGIGAQRYVGRHRPRQNCDHELPRL